MDFYQNLKQYIKLVERVYFYMMVYVLQTSQWHMSCVEMYLFMIYGKTLLSEWKCKNKVSWRSLLD